MSPERAGGAPGRTGRTPRAGEVYFWPAGHAATTDEACVFIEVGPTAEMRQFSENAKRVLGG